MSDRITLAHGNGGLRMRALIEDVLAHHLGGPRLDTAADAARLPWRRGDRVVMTTDGFIVDPLEFPGGDIGSLAINGTVNDLAVAGAVPRHIALALMIEEGLATALLERIAASMARAAAEAGVDVVTGDTKVVPRGQGGGLYITTTGIGSPRPRLELGFSRIRAGDAVLVSGPLGDHGIAVMLAREAFELEGSLASDCAAVTPLVDALADLGPDLRFLRDPTRGGLATVAHEIAAQTKLGLRLAEEAVPVSEQVRAVCAMLGFDPLYLACEGRLVAVIAADAAERALARLRSLPAGREAAVIGRIQGGAPRVALATAAGGERVLDELEDDPLPRIC